MAVVGSEEIYPKIGESRLLARAIGAPYFPITPTFPLLGPLGAVPLPSKWRLEFCEPIPTDEYGPDAADDRALVFELSERVRDEIQRMVYENLVKRGGPSCSHVRPRAARRVDGDRSARTPCPRPRARRACSMRMSRA